MAVISPARVIDALVAVSELPIDALGSDISVARDVLGAEKLVNYTPSDGLLDQLTDGIGVSIVDRVMSGLTGVPPIR